MNQLWSEILGDEMLSVPRLSRIIFRNRFFHYPLRPLNALFGLGFVEACRIVFSYVWSRVRPMRPEDTFEQWVSNRFGRRLFRLFFKTYTEKVWGLSCSEIRAEWAAQRIQQLSLGRAVLNGLPLTRRSEAIRTLIHEFRYPRLGPGQMWEACRTRVEAMGGRVLLGCRVVSVEHEDGAVTAVRYRTSEGLEHRQATRQVISSAPLPELVKALAPAAPPDVLDAADGLRYRDLLVVCLILDREDLFPDNWLYVHSEEVLVGRIQNFGNWSRAMVPKAGCSALGLEYFCRRDDPVWNRSDTDMVALATSELGALRLAPGANVVDSTIIRMPRAYPVYDETFREHVSRIRGHLGTLSGLQTVGRNGLHKYNNQDHSMLTSILAVRNLLGEQHDVWGVNTDYEYLEQQRMTAPVSTH